MKIIPGPASTQLGRRIAEYLKTEPTAVFLKMFPDGETYIRFETTTLKDEEVVIVQTTSPPQDQRLIQLMLMADNAKDMEAYKTTAVIPYLAYSRQDKRFMLGEAFSIKTIVKTLHACGIERIITVNAHNPTVLKNLSVPITDLSAVPTLAEHFKNNRLTERPVSISMGKKAIGVAQEADNILHGGYDYVSSRRDVRTGVVTLEDKPLAVENRDVIIFDDIISSGGTMAKAVKMVKTKGAGKVYCACVHPLLIGDSLKRIIENGAEEVIGTDAVESSVSKVSIAPLIGKALTQRDA